MVHVSLNEREVEPHVIEALRLKLTDPATSLPQRYRVLFSLRNIQGPQAHAAMLEGEPGSPGGEACMSKAVPSATHMHGARSMPNSTRLSSPGRRPAGLKDPSALFRHEVAYCLGQRQDPAAVSTLIDMLKDTAEHPM